MTLPAHSRHFDYQTFEIWAVLCKVCIYSWTDSRYLNVWKSSKYFIKIWEVLSPLKEYLFLNLIIVRGQKSPYVIQLINCKLNLLCTTLGHQHQYIQEIMKYYCTINHCRRRCGCFRFIPFSRIEAMLGCKPLCLPKICPDFFEVSCAFMESF